MTKHILNKDGTLASGWVMVPLSYRMPWYEAAAPEYRDSLQYPKGTAPPKYLVRGAKSWNARQRMVWASSVIAHARKTAKMMVNTGDFRRASISRLTNKVMRNESGEVLPIYVVLEEWFPDPGTDRPKVKKISP